MIITFVGHGTLYHSDHLLETVKAVILEHIDSDGGTLFYCGGYGAFDDLCAKVCRSIQKERPTCSVIFVTPYLTEAQQKKMQFLIDAKRYDTTLYPPLEHVPPHLAIRKRNEWMMDKADLIIAYVEHSWGGAYTTLDYARRKKKPIVNIAEREERRG